MAPEHEIWIVQQNETPHNTILGVFATQQEAAAYAERVAPLHEGKVLYARYVIGYRRHSDEFLDYP